MHSKPLSFSKLYVRHVKVQNLQILVTQCIYTSHVRLSKRGLFSRTSRTNGLYDHRSVSAVRQGLKR